MNTQNKRKAPVITVREMIVFAMLGTLMFCSKLIMEFLPNIHLLGMLTITYTIVYRRKALIPIYIYVVLNGIFAGFSPWWIPYTYIWTILWAVTMLLPKNMPQKVAVIVYPIVCAIHGLFFGALYAPVQAIMAGFGLAETITWIATGFFWDLIHCIGNLAVGLLIAPMVKVLKRLSKA